MSEDDKVTWSQVDNSAISNKPFLVGHTVTGLSNLGLTYHFKLIVNNEVGSSESLPRGIVLAKVPIKPL